MIEIIAYIIGGFIPILLYLTYTPSKVEGTIDKTAPETLNTYVIINKNGDKEYIKTSKTKEELIAELNTLSIKT